MNKTEQKNVKTLKEELKVLAQNIKTAKQERKTVRFTGTRTLKSPYTWQDDADYACEQTRKLSYEFRHKHIAYCMLRGKSYEVIEPKVRQGNEPNMRYVQSLIEEYDWTEEQKKEFAERNKQMKESA